MKSKTVNIFLALMFIGGLSLLLYPTVSDYWNSFHQSRAISAYSEQIAVMSEDEYVGLYNEALEYNKLLRNSGNQFGAAEKLKQKYEYLLDVNKIGVMGYIEIPKIKCSLPIYHGVSEGVLQVAIGHIPWSSVPIGGEGNHIVVSGHRGLPSAKLFTDLDKLVENDLFVIRVLNEVITYEVESIRIVEPHEIETLILEEGKDLCTLVTCTPYGVNSHRMLVTGHRIDNRPEARQVRITSDAVQIEPIIVAPFLAIPLILILVIWLLIYYRKD